MRDDRQRLEDIIDTCVTLEQHITDRDELASNPLVQAAAQRWLEVIGEAAARLSPDIRNLHRNVAWQEVIGMRNILAHGYFDIDVAIVWQAISREVPACANRSQSSSSSSGCRTSQGQVAG